MREIDGPTYLYCIRSAASTSAKYFTLATLFALKGVPLLPKVDRLRYDDSLGHGIYRPTLFLRCFGTTSLRSLALVLTAERNGEVEQLLVALPDYIRYLQTFELTISHRNFGSYLRSFSAVLAQCEGLESSKLAIHSIREPPNFTLLATLASWHNLRQLSITTFADIQAPPCGAPVSREELTFPNLRVISSDLWNMGATKYLFKLCVYPALETLAIVAESGIVHTLIPRLDTQVSRDTLQSLSILGHNNGPAARVYTDNRIILSETLRPLQNFRNLQYLNIRIDYYYAIKIDDGAWETFAGAWPHLRSLWVTGDGYVETTADYIAATYKAIAHLARLCTKLETIDIVIRDGGIPDDVVRTIEALPTSSCLAYLCLQHSPIVDLHFAASWIAKILPRVSEVWRTLTPGGPVLEWTALSALVNSEHSRRTTVLSR